MINKYYKNETIHYAIQHSKSEIWGEIWIAVAMTKKGICLLDLHEDKAELFKNLWGTFENLCMDDALYQTRIKAHTKSVQDYLQDPSKTLNTLPCDIRGTDFQKSVWEYIRTIPLGKSCTYGEIAEQIKRPKASRAVGTACSKNTIALIVPCHRVIAKSGKQSYKWGRQRKVQLLELEGLVMKNN